MEVEVEVEVLRWRWRWRWRGCPTPLLPDTVPTFPRQPSQMPLNVTTIANHFQDAGWATSAYGKWDAGATSWGCTPMCRGFDYFAVRQVVLDVVCSASRLLLLAMFLAARPTALLVHAHRAGRP